MATVIGMFKLNKITCVQDLFNYLVLCDYSSEFNLDDVSFVVLV